MLTFPKLEKLPSKELCISQFNGIKTERAASEDSISLAYNISARAVPSLVTRDTRKEVFTFPEGEQVKTLLHLDKAYVVTEREGKMKLYRSNDFYPYILYYTSKDDEVFSTTICKLGKMICIFNLKNTRGKMYEALLTPYPRVLDDERRIELPFFVDVLVFRNRVFGISEDSLFACAHGDVENWDANEQRDDFYNKAFSEKQNIGAFFTACKTFNGMALFFTSKEMYKLTGTGADTFTLEKIADVGAINKRAVCECNGKLYFMSVEGLMYFNGKNVVAVHTPFESFSSIDDCMLCAGRNTLYIDIKTEEESSLYTYNTVENAFAQEEEWSFVASATFGSKPYFANSETIYEFENAPSETFEDKAVSWRVETQRITDFLPKRNGTVKVELGLNLKVGATANVYADVDDNGWQLICTALDGEKDICVPLAPTDIKSIKIAVSGLGEAKVRYIKLRCNDSKRG